MSAADALQAMQANARDNPRIVLDSCQRSDSNLNFKLQRGKKYGTFTNDHIVVRTRKWRLKSWRPGSYGAEFGGAARETLL